MWLCLCVGLWALLISNSGISCSGSLRKRDPVRAPAPVNKCFMCVMEMRPAGNIRERLWQIHERPRHSMKIVGCMYEKSWYLDWMLPVAVVALRPVNQTVSSWC